MAINRNRPARLRALLASAALAAASLAGTASPLQAQAVRAASALHAGTLEVPINKSQVVNTDRPIAKAMIGNDTVADILPITDRSVYVLGKKMGTTSLTLYDSLGRVMAVMDVEVGPDVEALSSQMKDLIPGEAIDARITNGSVVLTGLVNNPAEVDRAMQLAKAYAGDGKVINLVSVGSSQQVMLEVRFAEVTRSTNKDIGVRGNVISQNGRFEGVSGPGSQYFPGGTVTSSTNTTTTTNSSANGSSNTSTTGTINSNTSGSNTSISGSTGPFPGSVGDFTNLGTLNGRPFTGTGSAGANQDSSNETIGSAIGSVTNSVGAATVGTFTTVTSVLSSILQNGSIADGFGIFRGNFKLGGLNLQGVLNAMEQKGMAKTLAQPTLLALSGERASFLAGGEFPVPVAQSNSGGSANSAITVEFKPFGVSLAFTPTVLSDRTINLVVEPEVSAIDPTASYSIGNITIPGLKTRRASTTLELRDGESFAIAGLLSKDFQTSIRQIPILGSLPIIGSLFRSSGFQKGETELLIVVTPRLAAPITPAQVRLPTDRVADPNEADTFLLGQPYKALPVRPAAPTEARPTAQAPSNSTGANSATTAAKDPAYAY